jgi:hypothetical protein
MAGRRHEIARSRLLRFLEVWAPTDPTLLITFLWLW